jgi:hypothetical protein
VSSRQVPIPGYEIARRAAHKAADLYRNHPWDESLYIVRGTSHSASATKIGHKDMIAERGTPAEWRGEFCPMMRIN